MSCLETIQAYALRSIGYGERMLPTSDVTLCEQFTLIGSGLLWNIYFGTVAIAFGFFLAVAIALGKSSKNALISGVSDWYIYIFRGSPMFIQLFLAYELFSALPRMGVTIDLGFLVIDAHTKWLTRAWAGALITLCLNTAAYSGKIFYDALQSVPRADVEAAKAFGFSDWHIFRRITWPTALRLAWPAYTNEAIFLFHATTLVFFAGFPAWQQRGDALYYARYFAETTYNPFVPFPIIAVYYVGLTLVVIAVFAALGRRLTRHMRPSTSQVRGTKRISYLFQRFGRIAS